jgi:undecaprenyl diphosphate synthase
LKKDIDYNNLPEHIAIIMDGNGRWAKKRMLPHSAGHKAGSETLKAIVEEAEKIGIKYVTVYAFSTENWDRPKEEVDYLMNLMDEFLTDNLSASKKNNYKIQIIGQRQRLRKDLQDKIKKLELNTKDKKGINLIIAISYGGRDEIARAVKEISRQVVKGAIQLDRIDEALVARYLDTKDIKDPDLLIRTSGEQRTSNFLIWQSAYSELYFSDKLWPDFNADDLKTAIIDYQSRERRFGGR